MAQDRVDKAWQSKGLGAYSTEAILGTLKHYGVELDEARFHDASKSKWPMRIAIEWQSEWKGTGQFAAFPAHAVNELWKRWEKDRPRPSELSEQLLELLSVMGQLIEGAPNAPVQKTFDAFTAFKAKIPMKGAEPDEDFVEEAFMIIGREAYEAFGQLAERMAKEGHEDDAETFAEIEEFLFPRYAGLSKAMVKSAAGKKDDAIASVDAAIGQAGRTPEWRLSAVETLMRLEQWEKARGHAETLMAELEKMEDWHLALAAADRLRIILDTLKVPQKERVAHLEKMEEMVEAHHKAHPHHAH